MDLRLEFITSRLEVIAIRNKEKDERSNRLLLGAKTLLGAPGLTTRSKKLLGAPGIATRMLLGWRVSSLHWTRFVVPGGAPRRESALRGVWLPDGCRGLLECGFSEQQVVHVDEQ